MNMPNKNIMHIVEIEGLFTQIENRLKEVEPNFPRQRVVKDQMVEEVDLMQKTTLKDMHMLFERS